MLDVSSKQKIKNKFYKVGFVPFTKDCLNNLLMRHELDENSNESESLRQLQSDYITPTLEAEKLGFNNMFTARLPKAKNNNESNYKG